MIKKYDIVKVDLNPKKWHTQAGIRPAIVVQGDLFNKYAPTILVVPLTSNLKEPFPSEFIIKKTKINGLDSNSRVLWSQIITLDKDLLDLRNEDSEFQIKDHRFKILKPEEFLKFVKM